MFSTIAFLTTIAAIIAFGIVYTRPRLMSYHDKIIARLGEDEGANTLRDAFLTLMSKTMGTNIATAVVAAFGFVIVTIHGNVGHTTTASIVTKCCFLMVLIFLCAIPYFAELLLRRRTTVQEQNRVAVLKRLSGISLIILAATQLFAYCVVRVVVNKDTSPIEVVLLVFLCALTFDTRNLGKKTGVRTPWWAPLGFACLMLAGITVELIQT